VQTSCPQCSQGIIIDDAKIPDRPFSVKCPRCKHTVRFPGRGDMAAEGETPTALTEPRSEEPKTIPPAPSPLPPPASHVSDELRAQLMAQVRREISLGEAATAGRALVHLPDRGQAGAATLTLTRLGFAVDTIEDGDEAAHLVEQGLYAVLVLVRVINPPGKVPTFFQKLSRLGPDARRRVFVIVAGDEYKSGNGIEAFTALADLVLHPRDLGTCDNLLRATLSERQRLYQAFMDARARLEAHA
jgi:predicted Zn finger-like uncharacterized protein